jgi:hypothetical protein
MWVYGVGAKISSTGLSQTWKSFAYASLVEDEGPRYPRLVIIDVVSQNLQGEQIIDERKKKRYEL